MKKILFFIFLCLSIFNFGQKLKTNSNYSFYENKGQIVDQNGKENLSVQYLFNGNGLNVQIKKDGFSYDVYEVKRIVKKKSKQQEKSFSSTKNKAPEFDLDYQYHRVDINFVGANKNPEIVAEGQSEDYDNYYNIPNKPKGIEKVHRYQKITYRNLYSNIDLVFFKPEDTLKPVEYNFIVNPGGKISDIQLKFKGAKTKLKDGKLSMNLRFGEMQENIPHSWEEVGNAKKTIAVEFKDLGNQTFGFATDKDISDKVMVIDPVPTRIWGTYFGGNGEEFGDIKIDTQNNLFLYGYTGSTNNVATSGAYQTTNAGFYDAFVTKISKDGQRFWGTYYGGIFNDFSGGVDIDASNNVYLAVDIEIPNPAYPGNPYYLFPQITLLKLNSNGTLIYEKTFGGNGYDGAYDVMYKNNAVYIIGETTSTSGLTTPGAFQENLLSNYHSGFVSRFNANNGNTDWITYVSGNHVTSLNKIFNFNNGIEIIGLTRADNIPMVDPFQSTNNNQDHNNGNNGLYLKFSETGSLLKSSYIGENESYQFNSARRFGDDVIFGSQSQSKLQARFFFVNTTTNIINNIKSIPVHNSMQTTTYIDENKNIYIAGLANIGDSGLENITTPDGYMPIIGKYDKSYFLKYDANFNKIWGTYFGGNGGTQLGTITKDNDGFLYFYGLSYNNTTGIATPGTFQQTGGHPSNDMFIEKFADCTSNVNVSFTPTCIGQNLELKASGGISYEWFGPNGFHTFTQNPIITNAQASDSGEYFVRITGGQSCGGIFNLIVSVGNPTAPVLDIPNLPNITAFCSTIITTIPTATTGCGTKINATTTDPLSYNIPGNYVIHWNYNDGNGNTLSQTQNVIINSIALPTANSTQDFCFINSPKISDIQVTGTTIKWYDSLGNILNTNTLLVDGTTYFATQTLNGCESSKLAILAKVNNPNPPTGNALQDFCSAQLPKIYDIIVIGQNIKFFDNLGNILASSTLLIDGETYYATQTINGCESSQKLVVKVSITNGGIAANNYSKSLCNDTTSNTKSENLFDYKSLMISNPSDYSFDFFYANNQLILDPTKVSLSIGSNVFNVKISNALGCSKLVQIVLNLNPKPSANLPPTAEFCNGQSVDLDAGFGLNYQYEWTKDNSPTVIFTKQILKVSENGKYSVKIINSNLCENSATTLVTQSLIATIARVDIVNNNATVTLSESGNFLYSLDNITWQTSNVFKNLSNGNHTVYVKTAGNCIIGFMNFTIFEIPNVFSPNGDGINDTWKIDGLENYINSEVKVLDKYGTIVLNKKVTGSFEWNGKSNSMPLPTGNYWYQIKLSDGRIMAGYVAIKNRN